MNKELIIVKQNNNIVDKSIQAPVCWRFHFPCPFLHFKLQKTKESGNIIIRKLRFQQTINRIINKKCINSFRNIDRIIKMDN